MSNKYDELTKVILLAVGGKENISYFQHCTTRLRFNLKDRSIVKVNEIEEVDKVLGVQWSNDELQIIIGPAVADAYKNICKIGGIEVQGMIDENLDEDLPKQKLTFKGAITGIMDGISGCITPLIPMMIAGGMIKVLYMLANMAGFLPETSTTYQILYWVGDAFIYYFPIFLGATAAKKFGANQGLGMLFGALLVYPSFINAATEGLKMTLFGLPVYVTNYASTVIPIIMCVYVMAKIEKAVSKFSPDAFKSLLVPLITLLIILPLGLCLIAPFGYYIGTYISLGITTIYDTIGFVGVALLCATLPLLVMTGMHTMMTPYWTSAFASLGYDAFFLPAMIISNLNQATASAAVAFKAKGTKLKSTALSCAITAYVAGVTEPAMFGITLKYKKPLYAAMIGNAVAGIIIGINSVACYAFPGSGGIFAIVTFVGPKASNLIYFLIAAAVGMVVTFILTYMLGVDENE